MEKPKKPPEEAGRLETLRSLGILDTAAEERYDRITRVAQSLFEVPIVLVSLVDADRQWFKSRQGLDATETPRDISFCGHAILGSDSFIIDDAAEDPRFADNPLVLGGPKLRFYAGAPLSAPNGQRVGTLCLIDTKPRRLNPVQRQVLRDLADMVEREMATISLEAAVARSEEDRRIVDTSLDLICVAGFDGKFKRLNSRWTEVLGFSLEELLASPFIDFVHPDDRAATLEVIGKLGLGGELLNFTNRFRTKDGAFKPFLWSARPYLEGGVMYAAARDMSVQDRTKRRLAAQFAVSKALAGAATWREGAAQALAGVCSALDWKHAGCWEIDPAAGDLYCSDFWSARANETEFSRVSRRTRFGHGIGLPGRSWARREPAWIVDVTLDANFPRVEAARADGVRAGIAMPVIVEDKVEAVLEFFDTTAAEPDDELLDLFASFGRQLGDFRLRCRSEIALRKSVKEFADLRTALNASAIVVVTDAAGRIVSCNKRFTDISGYSQAELIGQTHKIVNSGRHPHGFFKKMWETIRAGKTWRGEICNRSKSGGLYWVDTTITPFLGADGEPFQYIAIRHEITAQKLLSADFEGQVNAIGKSLAVVEFDLDGTILGANENFLAVTGYALEEIRGEHHRLFCPPEYAASDEYADFWAALNRGEYRSGEFRRIGKSGREVWIQGSYNPIIGLDGKPIKIVKYAVDITARKRAEATVAALGARLQAVLDNATQVAIITTDLNGAVTVFNRGAENILGYKSAEVLGKSPAIWHVEEEVKARGKLLSMEYGRTIEGFDVFVEPARQGGFDSREWTYVRKDGACLPVKLSVTALRGPDGEINGFLGIAVDVTESRRARDELGKARDAALDLAKTKAEFLANMSHEIRTPMNAVIGMTGLLMDTELSADQREFCETIRNAGESLLAIIGDILDFSKIEAGGMELEILDFDPRLLAEEVVMLFAARAQDKGLEIAAAVDEGLPPRLRADAGRMRQVLSNFVSNAIKFTEKGEILLRVRKLSEDEASVRVRFEVRDSGIGIDESGKAKLFQAFSQADASTTRKYGGTGLGLAICKKLVELMQGTVGVDSVVGTGSTFWFEMILRKGAEVPLLETPEVEGVRVLIVDDNATNRQIVARQTESWRMRPVAVDGGEAALAALRTAADKQDPFVLALVDMQMPGMDGLELARRIKQDRALAGTQLILLSSMTTTLKREKLIEIGFAGSLSKPVRKSSLFDAISDVLSGSPSAGGGSRPVEGRPVSAGVPVVAKRLSWAKLRILIAEDNAVNQRVALLQLKKLGCKADTVANGREAVEAVAAIGYDLVFMDCQMPEMDGFEAARMIRSVQQPDRPRPVIVAMTANALEGDREKCLAAGMDDYIPKPVRVEILAETIGRWNPTVDPAVLAGLRELGEETEIAQLIEDFLLDGEGAIEALEAAVKAGDASTLQKRAHSLKGTSGTLGAVEVSELARELETLGSENRLEGAGELIEALKVEIADAAKQLRAKPV